MFLGGALGGVLGARWHTKLERRAEEEVEGRHLTEARPAPVRTTDTRTDERPVGSTRAGDAGTTDDTTSTTPRTNR
jgi:hypothetical protein